MSEFRIKSSDTDLQLKLSELDSESFTAQIKSFRINATRTIWTYTDIDGIANLIESLASQQNPWFGVKCWESVEGEFKLSASCSSLGKVTFGIELSDYDCSEAWLIKTQLSSEFGQLSELAKSARAFFGNR